MKKIDFVSKHGTPHVSVAGKKFNRLTLIEVVEIGKKGLRFYSAKCECGNFVPKVSGIKVRHNLTKSCGCLFKEYVAGKSRKYSLATERICWQAFLWSLKRHPTNHQWTHGEWSEITNQPCFYCGEIDSRKPSKRDLAGMTNEDVERYTIKKNGLDRVDSGRGYDPDNVVSCCGSCNVSKSDMSVERFLGKVKLIYERMIKNGNRPTV